MLGDHAYDLLRRSATLGHAVPGASLTITADELPVLVVTHRPTSPPSLTACSPCGFRSAVATAWERHRAGARLSLLGLDDASRLGVTLSVAPCGEVVEREIVRIPISGRLVTLLATTLPPTSAEDALSAAGLDTGLMSAHHDTALATTTIHVDTALNDRGAAVEALDLMRRVRDTCAVAELLAVVAPASAPRR